MEQHPLASYTAKFIQEHGVPQVLDVEHSIIVHKPTLTGSDSPASYYIRPPAGMSAEEFVLWFESIPSFRDFRLTLVPISGMDTFHQPLISVDDFAKKYFHDNHARIVRVVGKLTPAVEAMVAFINALKQPFDPKLFPHLEDFAISGHKKSEHGGATELKLLYKPSDHNQLMKVERLISVHLDECNLGKEIGASRHSTRDQPPELILALTNSTSAGQKFLEALIACLPKVSREEVKLATEVAQRVHLHPVAPTHEHAGFTKVEIPVRILPPNELKKNVIAVLAEFMKASRFADGKEVNIVQAGTTIEVLFPRSISKLWLATTFSEEKQIKEVSKSCVGVRTDPVLRAGWTAVYNFDSGSGKLHIRALEDGAEPITGWKVVPR